MHSDANEMEIIVFMQISDCACPRSGDPTLELSLRGEAPTPGFMIIKQAFIVVSTKASVTQNVNKNKNKSVL